MRSLLAVFIVLLGFGADASAQGPAPSCTTGLCLQQMSCPSNGTTSISGVVYAPNGMDPLPNVLVYIPNATVTAFTPGVSCPVVGAAPSGSPIVGATTATDGSFTITNVPVGTNIPLVIVSGRWRRQFLLPSVTACGNTALPMGFASFPQNQTQGDIPKFAVSTGGADSVECVLRKVGINDSEFTDPSGNGRINLYLGAVRPGAMVDSATPAETTLMGTAATLNGYDVLMLPCEGTQYTPSATELGNLISFANAGGRIYASHYSYSWMWTNPPFDTVVNWTGNSSPTYADGTLATVNANFSGGATLSGWLNDVGASSGVTPAQIGLTAIKRDFSSVNLPTESWLTLNEPNNPVMQFVFDTPVPTAATPKPTQCGRVLFNEYHVENPTIASPGKNFPAECAPGTTLSPQEKLLEYSLFELTNDGGAATLTPTTQDFGTQAVGFPSSPQTFTWTNNSTFSASVTLLTGSGDFSVTRNNCSTVAAYASCTITVVFTPTVLGAETGTLTVGSSGTTLTAALTGTGSPALTLLPSALSFGSLDVGATRSQTITVSNNAPGSLPLPALVVTGDYSAASGCASTLAAGTSCQITVTFKPTMTGTRPGTVALNAAAAGAAVTLSGNGVDFTFAASPTTGSVIAGLGSSTTVTTTPVAGFAASVALTCTVSAPGSTCTLSSNSFAPSAPVATTATITTTSQYTVVGYGGLGGPGWLSLIGVASGMLLWMKRRSLRSGGRVGLTLVMLALALGVASVGLTGCSGKLPAQNANYTLPGPYTYTLTATDGFLVHSATYTLTVTSK